MKALIIYDSVFGNTKQVALEMGNSLSVDGDVSVTHVNDFKTSQLDGIDLLVVGSPTRAFKPTKATVGFIDKIPAGKLKGVKVLAFDTRSSVKEINNKMLNVMVKFFGYAAEPIAEKLTKKGGTLVKSPEGFIVSDTEGPMKDGEIERAKKWVKI